MNNLEEKYYAILEQEKTLVYFAKKYILSNWKKIYDWSGLNIMMNSIHDDIWKKEKTHEWYHKNDIIFGKFFRKPNPIYNVDNVEYDDIDGDFSVTINNTVWTWISNENIIKIAAYIEKQLNK